MGNELNMEEIVRQDPHITSITYTVIPPLPNLETQIEYGLFPTLGEGEVQKCLSGIYSYLRAPIILDKIVHHPERRIWVAQMEERYGQVFSDYIQQNKLRGNAITVVNFCVSELGDYYTGEQKEKVGRLAALINNLSTPIADDHTPLEHKLNLLPLFDKTIIAYVSLFRKVEEGRV